MTPQFFWVIQHSCVRSSWDWDSVCNALVAPFTKALIALRRCVQGAWQSTVSKAPRPQTSTNHEIHSRFASVSPYCARVLTDIVCFNKSHFFQCSSCKLKLDFICSDYLNEDALPTIEIVVSMLFLCFWTNRSISLCLP